MNRSIHVVYPYLPGCFEAFINGTPALDQWDEVPAPELPAPVALPVVVHDATRLKNNVKVPDKMQVLPRILSGVEIHAGVTTILQHPEAFGLSEQMIQIAERIAKDMESNPNLVSSFNKNVNSFARHMVLSKGELPPCADLPEGYNAEYVKAATTLSAGEYWVKGTTTLSAGEYWDLLKDKYPCCICVDVLAAPTLLSCSHSFCGQCFEDHRNRCVPCDGNNLDMQTSSFSYDNVDVVVECPTCRQTVLHTSFERTLDGAIEEAVRAAPDCEYKELWKERQKSFKDLLSARLKSAQRSISNRPSRGVRESGEEDESITEELYHMVLTTLVVSVAIFMVSRYFNASSGVPKRV
jgi:hypothetical protein